MGYDVHITRQQHWIDEDAALEISLQEWLEYIQLDNSFEVAGDGIWVWTAYIKDGEDANAAWFQYRHGNITVKNPDQEILGKMVEISEYFIGSVIGDEGEWYIRAENGIEIIPVNNTPTQYTYICFTAPGSPPVQKPKLVKSILVKLLRVFIPMANPDFDGKIDEVKQWLVECETATGVVNREIGLGEHDDVLMIMPYNKNYGYWIDNNLLLKDFVKTFNVEYIDHKVFEKYWSRFPK